MKFLNIFSLTAALNLVTGLPISLEKRDLTQQPLPHGLITAGGNYPRATKLNDNSYLATNGAGTISVFKSSDATVWWPSGSVASAEQGEQVGNGFPYQTPDGKTLVAYRNHGPNQGDNKVWRITISEYDGTNWKHLADPVVNNSNNQEIGDWEPFLRTGSDGSIQLYYSHELNNQVQQNYLITSSDGGKNWSNPPIVVSDGDGSSRRDGMIGVAPYDDNANNLIAVFESLDGDNSYIGSVQSSDGGKTWGNRQKVHVPDVNNFKVGAPQIVKVGNNHVVSFQSNVHPGQLKDSDDFAARLVTKPISKPVVQESWSAMKTAGDHSMWNGLLANDDSSFFLLQGTGEVQKWTL